MITAQALAQQAKALADTGDDAGAAALFARALADYPDDARLANSAGNFHFRAGRIADALILFEQALAIMPGLVEAGLNAAIACLRLGRAGRAVAILTALETAPDITANYWRIRSDAERQAGAFRAASHSMTKARALAPHDQRMARSNARLALERSDPQVLSAHEQALDLIPGDPNLLHDYAQALAVQGRLPEALEYTAALVEHLPGWIDGLKLHAELRWAAGDRSGFADHFARSAAMADATAPIYLAWSETLSGVDRHDDAAGVLALGRTKVPDAPDLALAQAIALGEAGQAEQAQAILSQHAEQDDIAWQLTRGRSWLRLGETAKAEAELNRVLAADPDDVNGWALIDLCWRLQNNPRHEWLHGQEGLVRQLPLPLSATELAAITALLVELHHHSAMPIGQSVKDGSQTKGALFARLEPEIERLEAALLAVIEDYRAGLPPADAHHPLLSRRDTAWRIAGSWSIRLDGQGHHAAHIHPRGLLSSASYFIVPPEIDAPGAPGWLELGRPPPGLADGLGALRSLRPVPGTCVLFPSTLFHGTRPIASGTRMTVAFDVTDRPQA